MADSLTSINSRYVKGGFTNTNGRYLGWWERIIIPKGSDDIDLIVTEKYAYRPDLIAKDVYGKETLMWLVLQYNNIVDINELINGVSIKLPSTRRIQSILSMTRFKMTVY